MHPLDREKHAPFALVKRKHARCYQLSKLKCPFDGDVSREKSDQRVSAFTATDGKSLRDLAEHYDPDITALENQPDMENTDKMIKDWEEELVGDMKDNLADQDVKTGPEDPA